MFRRFFANVFLLIFTLLIFLGLVLGVFFSTFANPTFIKQKIIPESYEPVIAFLAKQGEGKIKPQSGKMPQDWLKSVFPKETYSDILSKGIDDLFSGLAKMQNKEVREIDFKNTKEKLIGAIKNAFLSLPACEGAPSAAKDSIPTCLPKQVSKSEREKMIPRITQDIDASFPSRIAIPKGQFDKVFEILAVILSNRNLIQFGLFFVPVIIFILFGLLIYRPFKKILYYYGKAFLTISFEAFLVMMAMLSLPNALSKAPGILPSHISSIKFLFGFPAQQFRIICILFAVAGFAAIVAGILISRASAATSEKNLKAEAILAVRNGKLRRGSIEKK